MTRIVIPATVEELDLVKTLLLEYWDSFGFAPSFQSFSDEIANLPGPYVGPGGRIGLAFVENQTAGCIALRPVDATRGEGKRFYVRKEFRRHGLGKALLEWLVDEARTAGYSQLVGDAMPWMSEALTMYERFGFRPIQPYSSDPTPGAIYLSRSLEQVPA